MDGVQRNYRKTLMLPSVEVPEWDLLERLSDLLRPYGLVEIHAEDSRGSYSARDLDALRAEVSERDEAPKTVDVHTDAFLGRNATSIRVLTSNLMGSEAWLSSRDETTVNHVATRLQELFDPYALPVVPLFDEVVTPPVFFHVYVFERYSGETRRGQSYLFTNLDEEQLRTRIVAAWDRGERMTWGGRTADSMLAANIMVFRTEGRVEGSDLSVPDLEAAGAEKVTDEWIVGPAGHMAGESEAGGASPAEASNREGRIFLVHGHDERTKQTVARFLDRITKPGVTILDEQAGSGRTLIEKFEDYASEAIYAVVLLTGDDEGRRHGTDDELRPRARQNVILELGFFVAQLGRSHVTLLYEEGVELPSDISGVSYLLLDAGGAWKTKLAREMVAAELEIDAEAALSA
jgi:predicted nucleotide-binding protein